MLSVIEAQSIIENHAKNFGVETISLDSALGRVLAENCYADRDYPPFHRAAMDGYAFRAEDLLIKGIKEFTILDEVYAGSITTKDLVTGSCYKIMTGAPTPESADTIIRVEDTQEKDGKVSFLISTIRKGQNRATQGEDKKEGGLIIPKNTVLNPIHIASLAVVGKSTIEVLKLPSVAIISTGNEIRGIDEPIESHQIRESNSYSIESFLKKYGIVIQTKVIVSDDKEKLEDAIKKVLYSDIIILSGGVSMGDADFVPEVLEKMGIEKCFHKVAVKPGKPLWFGKNTISKGVVFGLPGNPFSVQVVVKLFIEPYLEKSFGLNSTFRKLKIPIAVNRTKKGSFDEYFPCQLETTNLTRVKPIANNGSGDVTSIVLSDGIALQEGGRLNLTIDDSVEFIFW